MSGRCCLHAMFSGEFECARWSFFAACMFLVCCCTCTSDFFMFRFAAAALLMCTLWCNTAANTCCYRGWDSVASAHTCSLCVYVPFGRGGGLLAFICCAELGVCSWRVTSSKPASAFKFYLRWRFYRMAFYPFTHFNLGSVQMFYFYCGFTLHIFFTMLYNCFCFYLMHHMSSHFCIVTLQSTLCLLLVKFPINRLWEWYFGKIFQTKAYPQYTKTSSFKLKQQLRLWSWFFCRIEQILHFSQNSAAYAVS